MASAPHGTSPHAHHESVAGRCAERRSALQEEAVAHQTSATGIVPVGSLGESATERSVGVAGSTDPDNSGAEPGGGAGSGEVPRGTTTGDPSWCRSTHCAGVCADHRESGPLFVWQAGGEL